MTLSSDEFKQQCLEFVRKSHQLNDSWSLQLKTPAGVRELELDSINLDGLTEVALAKSEARLVAQCNRIWTFEYSVVYSESYEVPIMYLSVSDQDGSPVDIMQLLSADSSSSSEELRQAVSQVEHPFLFRPFYMVHPCRTRQFMEANTGPHYLICWLSTVGTLIGLRLDLRFAESQNT